MSHKPMRKKKNNFTTYIVSVISISVVGLAIIFIIMQPPLGEIVIFAVLFGISAVASILLGFLMQRFGWSRKLPSLTITLTIGYILAAGLTLFNIWLTERLMFINEHDLALGSVLLLFASGISVAFGYFFSTSVAKTIKDLSKAVEKVERGELSARVTAEGENEIAQLAGAFNRMAANLERVEMHNQALEASRRDLIAWVSHDLRTPLTSLSAMVDAMADGVVDDADTISRYFLQSQGEISRLSLLIDDLFDLARLDAGELQIEGAYSSMADLISDTLGSFAARAKTKSITLTGTVSPEIDLVWMASDKIERVLNNLMENALRHTPKDGLIEIRAQVVRDELIVSVQDNGEGIPNKSVERVFERFYRSEHSRTRSQYERGGAGLGLAIAKSLVEAHEGKIWVENQINSGTTFMFSLPMPENKPNSKLL